MEDHLEEVMLKEKEQRLIMNRVPKNTKGLFLEIAEEDFCGDYGMTLKSILDGYMMFKVFFENMDMKLDSIMLSLGNEEKTRDVVKTMSGRIVDKGGKKK